MAAVATGPPWSFLRAEPTWAQAADLLDQAHAEGRMSGLDWLRLRNACSVGRRHPDLLPELVSEIVAYGPAAAARPSGQRQLEGPAHAHHDLEHGQVRLGTVVSHHKNPPSYVNRPFGLNMDVLRTSLVVIGPPGSGKTRSFAKPVVEHLVIQALANAASVVVVDPKGDDFDIPGWFDHTIDVNNPTAGFSLYGGATDADQAADRLASALLPATSGDKAYFIDSSKNALYWVLEAFTQAFGRWPRVRELLGALRCDTGVLNNIKAALGQKKLIDDYWPYIEQRKAQAATRVDPAASLIERFSLLDRPSLVRLFDETRPCFEMRQINSPSRVRVVLAESQYPEASKFLARLVISQFVQVTSAPDTNRAIFKGFVCDEAGPFVDDYVSRALQKVRSNNAGLTLLAQSLGDFPPDLLDTIMGSAGCRALFGGTGPRDAEYFSKLWGSEEISDLSHSTSRTMSVTETPLGEPVLRESVQYGTTVRHVERAIWSPGEIVNSIPAGHCITSVATSNGHRSPPLLVNLRT